MDYSDFFPAALALAQRAVAASEMRLRPAALIFRFFAGALATEATALADFEVGFPDLILAHRAFCAAETLARPAALICRFPLAETKVEAPRIETNSWFNASIFSLRSAARRNWAGVKDDNRMFIGDGVYDWRKAVQ